VSIDDRDERFGKPFVSKRGGFDVGDCDFDFGDQACRYAFQINFLDTLASLLKSGSSMR